jgi:glycerate 2-kinase
MRFDPRVLAPDPDRRGTVLSILEAALDAVDPAAAVARAITGREGEVIVGGAAFRPRGVMVVALGKAAPAMARAAYSSVGSLPVRGIVISDHGENVPEALDLRITSHPLPDERSVAAGIATMEKVAAADADELVLFLISGGGSALLEVPAGYLGLDDLIATQQTMLLNGVPIEEMNAVRRHMSAIKGGWLAAACSSGQMASLLVSDVAGGTVDVVASGPTVPDPSTYADALDVLERRGLTNRVPPGVIQHLQAGRRGLIAETPKEVHSDHVLLVIADGHMAAEAAVDAARRQGLNAALATAALTGEASEQAIRAMAAAPPGGLKVLAGETTVHVTGPGLGGRNQEAALAAAIAVAGDPDTVFAALGTDGIDGPTDAAGAVVDGGTMARGEEKGLDASQYLERNDSYRFLDASSDLLITGPTGTNVGDIWLIWKV